MGGAVDVVSSVLSGGPGPSGGALGQLTNPLSGLGKSIGGGFSDMNPFHKIDTTPTPTLQGPQQVQGPGASPTVGSVDAPYGAQLAGVGAGSTNDFRTAQINQINGLGDIASGKDQSAQRMLQMQTQQNVANQFAMANSARPGGQAAAMRAAMNNAAQMNAQANVQGTQLAMQNRMAASGLIGNIAGQGSGQDISVAGANAGNTTQASIAGGQQGTQRAIAQGQIDATTNGQNMQAQQLNQSAGLQYNGQLQGQWADVNGLQSKLEGQRRQNIGNFVGGVAGSLPVIGGMFGGGGGAGPNGSTGQGSNSFSGGTNPNFMGPPAMAHGGIVPTPEGIHIPYSVLLKRIVGGT